MFQVVIDGIFLVQVNKTLRVATPGSESENFITQINRCHFTLPRDSIFDLLDAFLIIINPMYDPLSYIYVTILSKEHRVHYGASKSCIKATYGSIVTPCLTQTLAKSNAEVHHCPYPSIAGRAITPSPPRDP